ncbi:MAG: hypothetical protein GY805_21560 [Chloroflexi bacterium]|nr:hypothetical protein [Chloroflexota bacterium]
MTRFGILTLLICGLDNGGHFTRMISGLELMATAGLILPHLTGILPWLTPVAAIGCALLLIGAIITHIRYGEGVMVNVVLLLLSLFVAYGRFVLLSA